VRAAIVSVTIAASLPLATGASAAGVLYIRGGGYGHGIGMSQYGAYGYALHGEGYRWILAHYYQGTALGRTNPWQVVRVLIATGSPSFSGATRASGPAGQKPVGLRPSVTYTVRQLGSGRLGVFDPADKQVFSAAAPLVVAGPGPLELAGYGAYRGRLEFRPSGQAVQTVNAVDLEDYLRGVVSAEMPAGWSIEALKAQAVAARTYAITSEAGGSGYQLYSDARSQMYRGLAAETPATDAAVAATRGQVVTYRGRPVATFFFASSGGRTEDIQNVWLGSAPEPWLRGVADPYDDAGGNPYYRWTVRLSLAAAQAKLGRLVKGTLRGIRVIRRGVSPRVVTAQVIGSRGTVDVSGPQLQQLFGLKSTYMCFAQISSAASTPGGAASGGGGAASGGGAAFSSGAASGGGGAFSSGAAPLSVANPFAVAARFEALPPATATLTGSVFPGARGERAAIQLWLGGRWRTIGRVRVRARGTFSASVHRPGVYRIVWKGLAGPATPVG
jgi:stage II sporulation protein D